MAVQTDNGGLKNDQEKDPWQLVPWDAVRAVTKVLAFGANKYAPRNWERGMDWDRLFRATIEHMTTWFEKGKADPETGFSHLWHAGCCIMFLIAYELRGIGRDNRPCAGIPQDDEGPHPSAGPVLGPKNFGSMDEYRRYITELHNAAFYRDKETSHVEQDAGTAT